MLGSKRYVPIIAACLFVSANGCAMAGDVSTSALDMQVAIPADSKVKTTSDEPVSGKTYVTMPGNDDGYGKSFVPKFKKPKLSMPKMPKLALHHGNSKKNSKHAESDAEPQIAKKPEKAEKLPKRRKDDFGGSLNLADSNDDKSGNLLSKGTKAIGSSLASTGEKMKDGMASLTHFGHDKNKTAGPKVATKPGKNGMPKIRTTFGQVDGNSSFTASKESIVETAHPSTTASNAPNKVANKEGFFDKAAGKIPFMKRQVAAKKSSPNPGKTM